MNIDDMIIIERAEKEDFEPMLDLFDNIIYQSGPDAFERWVKLMAFKDYIKGRANSYITVNKKDGLTGAIWAAIGNNVMMGYPDVQAYLTEIAVVPEYQGSGIGSAMMSFFISYCKEKEIEKIGTTVMNNSDPGLFLKFGFEPKAIDDENRDYIIDRLG